jgi:uncharacterized protein YukE
MSEHRCEVCFNEMPEATRTGACDDCRTEVDTLIDSWAGKAVTTRHKMLALKTMADRMESKAYHYEMLADKLARALKQASQTSLGVPLDWKMALDSYEKFKNK